MFRIKSAALVVCAGLLSSSSPMMAQQVNAWFGVGTATDSSNGQAIDTFGTGTPFATPKLNGTFLDIGGSFMLTPPGKRWQRFRIVMSCSMKGKPATAGTTRVNRAATRPHRDLEHYCRDLGGWPRSWMGQEKDVPPGDNLVACFRPFLETLAASDLSPKTIQKHVDNLWTLGGEIITHLNENPSLRRKSIEQILDDRIDEEGGPLVYAMESEELQQRSFDATCRKLYFFRRHQSR